MKTTNENVFNDEISEIKLITKDEHDAIAEKHPELNAFAEVILKNDPKLFTKYFLALEKEEDGKHYSKIILLGKRTFLKREVYVVIKTIKEFKYPIPTTPEAEIHSPSQTEMDHFLTLVKNRIGINYELICVITVGNTTVYMGKGTIVVPNGYSFPVIKVEFSPVFLSNVTEVKVGAWSKWHKASKHPIEVAKYVRDINVIPGGFFNPICFRTQPVSGTNVEIYGCLVYSGIGQTTSLVKYTLKYDYKDELISREMEVIGSTPTYF